MRDTTLLKEKGVNKQRPAMIWIITVMGKVVDFILLQSCEKEFR